MSRLLASLRFVVEVTEVRGILTYQGVSHLNVDGGELRTKLSIIALLVGRSEDASGPGLLRHKFRTQLCTTTNVGLSKYVLHHR